MRDQCAECKRKNSAYRPAQIHPYYIGVRKPTCFAQKVSVNSVDISRQSESLDLSHSEMNPRWSEGYPLSPFWNTNHTADLPLLQQYLVEDECLGME